MLSLLSEPHFLFMTSYSSEVKEEKGCYEVTTFVFE